MYLFKEKRIHCTAKFQLDRAIKSAREDFGGYADRCSAFDQLLSCVWRRTSLLRLIAGANREPSAASALFVLKRLQNFAHRHAFWIRPLDDWRPTNPSPRIQVQDLAHHLFARFPTPVYLHSVWDLDSGPEAFRLQSWFIRISRGTGFRALALPIPLTARMRHHLRLAPDDLTVNQAIRFSEVLGLGGGRTLARQIAMTRLGHILSNPIYWRSVIAFFVANADFPAEHISIAIDFLQAMRFGGEETSSANRSRPRAPISPDFQIEGRTTKSLLRLIQRWHVEAADSQRPLVSWAPSGIDHFHHVDHREDGMHREWSVVELCNSAALIAEGRAMSHCVAIYVDKCRRRICSIWSLRLRIQDMEKRVATIEVAANRDIRQIRARCNAFASDRADEMIVRWSRLAGLKY